MRVAYTTETSTKPVLCALNEPPGSRGYATGDRSFREVNPQQQDMALGRRVACTRTPWGTSVARIGAEATGDPTPWGFLQSAPYPRQRAPDDPRLAQPPHRLRWSRKAKGAAQGRLNPQLRVPSLVPADPRRSGDRIPIAAGGLESTESRDWGRGQVRPVPMMNRTGATLHPRAYGGREGVCL